jgi:epoxyqueuosine reductase
MTRLQDALGVISVYALDHDYHDIVRASQAHSARLYIAPRPMKVFVDTALMEKPLARGGPGWQSRHTTWCRAISARGSSSERFSPRRKSRRMCLRTTTAACRACLDICPTRLSGSLSTRCAALHFLLTIEHKGHIAREFRESLGNRIYGCDDCLAVCPWNKFASEAAEAKLKARDDLRAPSLEMLLRLDDAAFRSLFTGSPVKRTGRERFIRNVLIAAGNSGDMQLVPRIELLLNDASALVRAMAVWALWRLLPEPQFVDLRNRHKPTEPDANVRAEWDFA